jgi:DNA-binding transcriptional regulator YdaS (Cro superfamily)
MTGIAALKRAKHILGSQRALADVVGVKQPSVHGILNAGKTVPAEWCLAIERATQGQVTRHDLRPDLYPHEPEASQMAETGPPWRSKPQGSKAPYGGIAVLPDGSGTVPGSVMAQAGLRPGDFFVAVAAGDGDVRLLTGNAAIQHARELLRRHLSDDVDLVAELLKERRREADTFEREIENGHG